MDTGQGFLGFVAPEDLLSASCLVLPLLLSPLVLSPLAGYPWGSKASPGPLLGLSWTSPPGGPELPWVAPGLSWGALGILFGTLEPSFGPLGRLLAAKTDFGPPGCLLGASWAAPGGPLERFWALLAGSWAVLRGLGWLLADSRAVLIGLGWLLGGPGPGLALTRGRRRTFANLPRSASVPIYLVDNWGETPSAPSYGN